MIMTKLNLTLTKYKLHILISFLFILGLYHLLMCLVKQNAFNLSAEDIRKTKFIFIRFYHVSYSSLIGLGISFKWSKKINWIWLYLGFRILYAILRAFSVVDDIFTKTLTDGLSFGLLLIAILLILGHEKSK